MPLQGIQAGGPELPVRLKPLVDFPQRTGAQPVQAALGIGANGHQACFAQHPQVLRHGRLADAEHADKIGHRLLRLAQKVEDGAPVCLREYLEESGHTELVCLTSYIRVKAYKLRHGGRGGRSGAGGGGLVVLVGDVLVPERLLAGGRVPVLDREVTHEMVGGRAVPVPLPRPDHNRVTGAHLPDRAALALDPADALHDVQHLAERVHMPGGPGAGREVHPERAHQARLGQRRDLVYPHLAGEPVRRAAGGRPRSRACHFHRFSLTVGFHDHNRHRSRPLATGRPCLDPATMLTGSHA